MQSYYQKSYNCTPLSFHFLYSFLPAFLDFTITDVQQILLLLFFHFFKTTLFLTSYSFIFITFFFHAFLFIFLYHFFIISLSFLYYFFIFSLSFLYLYLLGAQSLYLPTFLFILSIYHLFYIKRYCGHLLFIREPLNIY